MLIKLPEIIAKIFALWSLSNCESFKDAEGKSESSEEDSFLL